MANQGMAAANPALQQAAMRAQLARMRPQLPPPGIPPPGMAGPGMGAPPVPGATGPTVGLGPGGGSVTPIANPGMAQALAQNPAMQNPTIQNPGLIGAGMGFARGGGVKIRRPKAKKMAAKQPVSTPSPYDYEDTEGTAPSPGPGPAAGPPGVPGPLPSGPGGTPPLAGPGMAKGGNFIQKAIKHPGALHRKLGVPEGEKIPAKKMAQAAKSSNPTTRKQVALAKTLKGFHKAKGGECPPEGKKMARGGKAKDAECMAAGGAAKQRKGYPNTTPPPKGMASGGKVRGCGIATKGCNFSGIY
jgi:hypothetical protein